MKKQFVVVGLDKNGYKYVARYQSYNKAKAELEEELKKQDELINLGYDIIPKTFVIFHTITEKEIA